jgi:serine O-acetyltransferase
MGVVIGETAEIGDDVLLYQGVVLGGTTLEKKKRHPTLGSNVVVGSAAILLGPITIGDRALIGANSVVVKSVPPGATVVGVPGRVVGDKKEEIEKLEHGKLPDPVAEAIGLVLMRQGKLVRRLKMLEISAGITAAKDELEEQIRELEMTFSQGEGI